MDRAIARRRGPRAMAVEWTAPMHAMDEVVVLLGGGGVPAAIDEAAVQAGYGLIPFD